jgi:signal transduction histidine kinase
MTLQTAAPHHDLNVGKRIRVLHVEDSPDDFELVERELRRAGFDPRSERVDTREEFKRALDDGDWDVIISDYSLPQYDGLKALSDLRATGKDIPFVLVSGTIGESVAVDAMRAGAQDYVLKGSLGRLPLAVEREVREAGFRFEQRRMVAQLAISERMASAGMLASGVAHEINNPLAIVSSNLDFVTTLLKKPAAEIDLRELDGPLQDAREAVDRIRRIVCDVKLFARPQDDERAAVDVRAVVESSIRMAGNEIRHRAHLVEIHGDIPLVDSNDARLGQILLNLLVNAAQAMPDGRASANEIRVTTKMADSADHVVIEISDTGMGIPKEILPRIFDPFFTTKAVGVGTGLGLALCHRMVTDLGGEITVESEVGKGTRFRVTLPIAISKPQKVAPLVLAEEPIRRAKVLIIDDELLIGRVLKRSLGAFHDMTVLTSGVEALAQIASGERFDVIFSDLMMPEISGMDLFRELSKVAPDQAKRMVFVTGDAFTEQARAFLDDIPNPCLDKPFEVATILGMISSVVRATTVD